VTLQRSGGASAFSSSAEAYAATMAPALRPIAAEVVRRAAPRAGESVLDVGTGTGNALPMLAGDGRRVVGVDAAAGMLALAAGAAPDVELVETDFHDMPFDDGTFDLVVAVHALLFADDRVAALREWRRVTAPGGRVSLSVPGPRSVVPVSVLAPVYDRYGITWGDDYPTEADLAGWAREAGWSALETDADPATAIPLRDEVHFRTWLRVGARGRATADWDDERRDAFTRDLMAAAPRGDDGGYRLPFGCLYLVARR
jgi:SAM-dependent methyltransferase